MDYSKTNFSYARKTNWKNPYYKYIKNRRIVEWDIASAGLSVIKFNKLLPSDEISKLESMDKHSRTVREGLYQRENPLFAEKIVSTLEDVREKFVSINNIPEENVLSIKKDALFIIDKNPPISLIDNYFNFRKKNEYSSFIILNNVEFLLNTNGYIETKGLSSESVLAQKNFLLKDIAYILKMAEKVDQNKLFTILENYRRKYLLRELPVETYAELDSGLFRLGDGKYMSKHIDLNSDMINTIDISQNYINYVLPLIQLLL